MSAEFYRYFSENMKALHLPAPESLFGTITTATATIGSMIKYIELYGTKETVREMILTLPGAFSVQEKVASGLPLLLLKQLSSSEQYQLPTTSAHVWAVSQSLLKSTPVQRSQLVSA